MEKTYQDIITISETYAQEQLEFLINLCNQNSHSYNKAGVDIIAEMIIYKLNGIMPIHQVFEREKVGNHHLLKNKNSSKSIYLAGHMDTVFPPEHSFQMCQIEGDTLKGPGSGDMKGGLAVIVYALIILNELKLLDKLNLALILNGDEEIGSVTSQSLFVEECKNAIACIVAECAGLNNEIVTSRNGKLGARIDCYGQDRHVCYGTHKKSSAILELAHKIIQVESLNACLPGVSINVGEIKGGLGPSTIPAHAHCVFDVRWVEEEHRNIMLEKINKIIISTPAQSGCRSEFKVLNSRPAMPVGKHTKDIFGLIQNVGIRLNQKIQKEHRRGTSDANFFGAVGVPTLDGLGPVCQNDHTSEEYIKISSIKERTALLALFLLEFSKKAGMLL